MASTKPAPDIFAAALQAAGGNPDSVGLGDSVWDIESAAAAGIRCVGVLTGGIDEADLRAAGAVAVYEDCADLVAHLGASPFAA